MYYVFFDTVDINFISRIAKKYCPLVFGQFYKDCPQVMQQHGIVDNEKIKAYFEKKGKTMAFLECSMFFSVPCSCNGCYNEHKSILASDQLKCFGDVLLDSKKEFLEYLRKIDPGNKKEHERLAFQTMCQNYLNIVMINKPIKIRVEYGKNRSEYLRLYAKGAKGYQKKNPMGFKYVRADATYSDYNDFTSQIKLHNITPCDDIYKVV